MADTTLVEPGAGAPAPMGSNNNPAAVYLASLAPSGRYSMMRPGSRRRHAGPHLANDALAPAAL